MPASASLRWSVAIRCLEVKNPDPYNPNPATVAFKKDPTTADLVAYMNDNARRVQAVQATKVTMDCKQGNELPIGLDAMIACKKPRDFRLKGSIGGKQVVDIGSNDDEFWYWISEVKPTPYLFHCSYKDMSTGQVRLPFPFNPDMIVCALNIADYDPNAHYEVKKNKDVIELIEPVKSMQGQDVFKVTIFNRGQVTSNRPQVLAYALRDKQGKDICTAVIKETQVNKETGAVLPVRVQIVFNGDKASERSEMTLRFYDPYITPIKDNFGDRKMALFSRTDLAHIPGYDLARGPDRAIGREMSGVRQTGGLDR